MVGVSKKDSFENCPITLSQKTYKQYKFAGNKSRCVWENCELCPVENLKQPIREEPEVNCLPKVEGLA